MGSLLRPSSLFGVAGLAWQHQRDAANKRNQSVERNAVSSWESGHSIDPNTGQLIGDPGSVPAPIALKWQDIHNQAIWNYRQRLMGASTGYLKGALGDLQRTRPGGAAALESGAYGQIAGNLMQRAEMTQPMDLLADYRRDAEANNRRRQRNASYLQLAGQLGSAAIMAAGAVATGGTSLLAAGAMAAGNAANGYFVGKGLAQGSQVQQPGQPTQTMMGPGLGTTGQVDPNSIGQQQGSQYVNDPRAANDPSRQWGNYQAPNPSGAPQGGTGQSILAPGGYGGTGQSMLASGGAGGSPGGYPVGGAGGPGGGPGAPGGAPGGAGAPKGGGAGMQGGSGAGARGPMDPNYPTAGAQMQFGANGDFSPLAAAAMAASTPHPMSHFTSLMVKEHLVESLEGDPDWGMLDAAYRRQALARGMAT